jgi:hypothetical protein
LIQSLRGDTWWADVSSPVRERLNASGARRSPSQAKPIIAEKKGMMREIPAWRPVRISSLAVAIMERPIWQPVLVSLLAVIIIVGSGLAVMHPWEGNNIALAADAARNNPQVQAILGEGEIETEVVLMGEIAHVKCSIKDTFEDTLVTVVINTKNMTVMAIHAEVITSDTFGPTPTYRPELTEGEKAEAIAIAEAEPHIQIIMANGFTLGEPSNSDPVLGADTRRVAWLPFEGDTASDEYRGVIVSLDDREDVTVIWEGDLTSWWPY